MQEEEGAPAAGDRTRIMRFTVGEQEDPVALIFTHHRPRIFSALRPHPGLLPSLASMRPVRPSAIAPERLVSLRPHVRGAFQIIR